MAIQTDATLKTYFQTGDTPTQVQFEALIDSKLPITAVGTVALATITEVVPDAGIAIEDVKSVGAKIAQGASETLGYITRRIEIGTWNMNVSGSGTANTTVTLPADVQYPDSITIGIIADAGPDRIQAFDVVLGGTEAGSWSVDPSGNVLLYVNSLGLFNSALYSGASNRGYIVATKFSTL